MSIDVVGGDADLSVVQGQEAVTDNFGDTDAAVQPQEEAQAEETQANAPESDDTGYSALNEVARKEVDAVITRMRQKDAHEREVNEARYNWARQIQELSKSDDPKQKSLAAQQLRHVANLIHSEEQVQQETPVDPFQAVDWESVDIVAPGLGQLFQAMRNQITQMQQTVEPLASYTRQSQEQIARAQIEKELADTKAWAESNGLPFDYKRVLEADLKHNLRDVKSAYHVAYRDEILESAKASERKRLETRKASTLPVPGGGSTPNTSAPPKTNDIHEIFRWVQSQR